MDAVAAGICFLLIQPHTNSTKCDPLGHCLCVGTYNDIFYAFSLYSCGCIVCVYVCMSVCEREREGEGERERMDVLSLKGR